MVAESLELVHGVAASAFGVAAGVVVGARVVEERPVWAMFQIATKIVCSIATSASGSAAGGDASVLGGEVGAVAVAMDNAAVPSAAFR